MGVLILSVFYLFWLFVFGRFFCFLKKLKNTLLITFGAGGIKQGIYK